mgnify:CR=1 FL=1
MDRKQIFDILDPVYPCYAIGEHARECEDPYVVLKFDSQLQSVNNAKCGWQLVHVFLYAPLNDVTVLDDMLLKVQAALKTVLEFTGEITPEIVDDTVKAYTRRLKYKIPKEVI